MSNARDPDTRPSSLRPGRRLGWRQAVLFTGALLGGTLAGAGGLSYAAMLTGSVSWHHGHRLERMQRHIHAALDAVGASSAQENKVHDIVATGFTSLDDDHATRAAMRKQMIDLLRAPTIDRAAVEKLRADQVAAFDARSKTVTTMLLDAADQLSPEQRAALADRAETMMARHHGGWHKWGGTQNDKPDGGMPGRHGEGPDGDGDHGPAQDGAPDKTPG